MTTSSEQVGKIKAAIDSKSVEMNVAVPCVIRKVYYDAARRIALVDVVPAINKVRMKADGSKQYETTAEIEGIPVVNPSCGDFHISMPLKPGCKGLLIFSDYDIDNWMDGNPNPHTDRYHDQNDCFFFPAFNAGRNDIPCLELGSKNVTVKICEDSFDVIVKGRSLMAALKACCPSLSGF